MTTPSGVLSTSLAQAADRVLQQKHDVSLPEWLGREADSGDGYRVIAARMADDTGGVVRANHETIRRWMTQLGLSAAGARR